MIGTASLVIVLLLCASPKTLHADHPWPTYRGDGGRTAFADREMPTEYRRLWSFQPPQPPAPAWPKAARGSYWQRLTSVRPRIVDDQTFHPVIGEGGVYFASSADDSVYCLDPATGQLRWRFTTDGPVRYAPALANDNLLFGSDDGQVYCVAASNGELIWQRRIAPRDRRIAGNGRVISAWPVRSSVLVDESQAFSVAGLYPSQGVYAVALDIDSGDLRWRQQIAHSAQGYLLGSHDRLFVPTGRGTPIALAKQDGQLLGELGGAGGTYAVVTEQELTSGRGNDGTLVAADMKTHQRVVSFVGSQLAASPRMSYLLSGSQLRALDRSRYMALSRQLNALNAQRDRRQAALKAAIKRRAGEDAIRELQASLVDLGKQVVVVQRQRHECERFNVTLPAGESDGVLAACRNAVFVGSENGVEIRAVGDGKVLCDVAASSRPLGIALGTDCFVVSHADGTIECFAIEQKGITRAAVKKESDTPPATPSNRPSSTKRAERIVASLNEHHGSSKGYCLIAGKPDAELVRAFASQSDLNVVVVSKNADFVRRSRESLLRDGVYGSRVAVHAIADDGGLPLADYLFNAVVVLDSAAFDETELMRALRPSGGVLFNGAGETPTFRGRLPGAGSWTHLYGSPANTANSQDTHTTSDLRLQWFGGPGPGRMVDRHLRAPSPLCLDGRTFIPIENGIVAIDSYNGTELWQVDLPQSQRYSIPYDCGYMTVGDQRLCVAVRNQAWVFDPRTGKRLRTFDIPAAVDSADAHWGFAALADSVLYGSAQNSTASRTEPSREQIDVDYTNEQPLVVSDAVFAMSPEDGTMLWHYRGGAILNSTITVVDGRVHFVECAAAIAPMKGRVRLRDAKLADARITTLDARTGDVIWSQPISSHVSRLRNIIYLQATSDLLIASGSYAADNDTHYRVEVFTAADGSSIWQAEHAEQKPGEFGHGEQVHHPVVLGDTLVAEPAMYDLATGRRIHPDGKDEPWHLVRPGHSCGTMSGAASCLFFRAGNPTVMDLSKRLAGKNRFKALSPTRPGCWINILPADGLVIIPEASASCVCNYPLQTSMAFAPAD